MPALVKVSSKVLSGGFALVRYSVAQTSELLLTVEAEFVGLPVAPENLFKIGSPPPSALLDAAGFVQTLQTYGAPSVPSLVDAEIVRSNGLKTISATYSVKIAASTVGPIGASSISVDENGQVVLTPTGGLSPGQDLPDIISPGTQLKEITTNTSWQSFSGSVTGSSGSDEGVNFSFSFDYLSISVTVSYSGGADGSGIQGGVGSMTNVRGIIPLGTRITDGVRNTTRTYSNSRGEFRTEITSSGYYYLEA